MAPRKVCHFHSFTQYLSENTSWEELDWLWAVLKPRVAPCSLILKSLWIATWSTESRSLPRLPAWLCFFCKFLQSHQLHVWDFDLLSVVLWGVEISSLSPSSLWWLLPGAPMVVHLRHCCTLFLRAKENCGKKVMKRRRRAIGKLCRVKVTVDHAHCKEKAAQGTEDTVQTCWLASIV